MNSYLITGATLQKREKKTKEIIADQGLSLTGSKGHPDLLSIQPNPSIGISQIRELQKFLSRRPYQALIKAVVVLEAEKITLPAQNAFLKTLEEPPTNSLIILSCQNQDNLLPTIISRCQIINLGNRAELIIDERLVVEYLKLLNKAIQASSGKRLILIEPYIKSREVAVVFCQETILALREVLTKPKMFKKQPLEKYNRKRLLKMSEKLQQTLELLQGNVNTRLALENLILSIHS